MGKEWRCFYRFCLIYFRLDDMFKLGNKISEISVISGDR